MLLGLLILIQSCTGQSPADIKNPTTIRQPIKASCSSMVFDGQILSKKNILNIFDCTGWSKKYPALNHSIANSPEFIFNKLLAPLNQAFLGDKNKRKRLFSIMAEAESRGELKQLASLLEKGVSEHKVVSKLNQFYKRNDLNQKDKSTLLNLLSASREENLKKIIFFKNLLQILELNKDELHKIFAQQDKSQLRQRLILALDELSLGLENRKWSYLSAIAGDGDSPLQSWALGGLEGDPRILLDVVENPELKKDIAYLNDGLKKGISCSNQANENSFKINVAQELKQVVDSLAHDSNESFQKVLLHGLTKYLAFQEFCEERESQQGLKSYFHILKLAFDVVNSDYDYNFLKSIHQFFQEDRFAFVEFLNSESFTALRSQLIDLEKDGLDDDFSHIAFAAIAKLNKNDLQFLSHSFAQFSDDASSGKIWLSAFAKFWQTQSYAEKRDWINLFALFMDQDIVGSQALSVLNELMEAFPDYFADDKGSFTNSLNQEEWTAILEGFDSESVQNDLSVFLSNKGLFEFFQVLTHEKEKSNSTSPVKLSTATEPLILVVKSSVLEENQTKICFKHLAQKYESNSTYYQLVNTLPESCLSVLGEVGFVGQIYLWMNSSESYFKDHYQVGNYHSAQGVWSPGMLQFIFSAAVKADRILQSANGHLGLQQNLDEIHRVLTDESLLETFHQFSQLFTVVSSQTQYDDKLTAYFTKKTNSEITPLVNDALTLLESAPSTAAYDIRSTDCRDISPHLGANPCMGDKELTARMTELLRILKRKNERGKSLLQTLLKWLHPQGGIVVPFQNKKEIRHHTDLDEVVRFLFDLSSPATYKEFTFTQTTVPSTFQGSTLDRLEVVIRDIGFLNNFYGAYFKNNVARAPDYRKEILQSEKLLEIMKISGGVLRGTRIFPKDTKDKLKNIKSTYLSLAEVADMYPQANGTSKTYGPFIQGLLSSIAESSKESTQDFNPYRLPKPEIVEGHNGLFLTQAVEMSALRHMAAFVRARFDKDLTALETERFKKINAHLVGRHELIKLQSGLQSMLDRYLDNDRHQMNLLLEDAVHFFGQMEPDEQRLLEQSAIKILTLLSDSRLRQQNMLKLGEMMEIMIQHWPEIRVLMKQLKGKKEALIFLNTFLDHLVENPEAFDRLFTELMNSFLSMADIKNILLNPLATTRLVSFLNQLASGESRHSDLNWTETFKSVLAAEDVNWSPVRRWIEGKVGTHETKLTLSLLIDFLGQKNDQGYQLKQVMDELFVNHREQLNFFLKETFKSLELKPD
jgi:hypothetical protein